MSQEDMINKLITLAQQSEARIDRTNEMACKMIDVCEHSHSVLDKITEEYAKHLADLSRCRNDLLEQNKTLLRLHEQDLNNLRDMRKEITDNTDRLFTLLRNSQGGIKIENK